MVKGKEEPIDLQIFDIQKAFDALWIDDCFNDLFDTLSDEHKNDKLALLYASNAENFVLVWVLV